ncbi:MAG: efflux RND transporter periplasmic adaptor subunit [Thiotrichales bacterium]|nr:MAG: efflux RND transporter periplasmic adaptor subunit [Thiotrichales bacterium]
MKISSGFISYCVAALLMLAPLRLFPAELETVPVMAKQTPRVYRLDGVVEAVRQTTISAQISGQVEAILFDVDDYVEKGEVVIRLNDKQPAARLKQARAELKEAGARLKEAEDEFERVKGVYEKKAVSEKAMDTAEAAKKAAQAKLEAARAGLESAQEQLEYTQVRAPYSGIVTERHIELGETAQPGNKLVSGLSLEHLRVTVDVPQKMINQVRQAETATIETMDGESIAVSNTTVFPYAEPGSHTFRVRLDFKGDSVRLFPGMFVKAIFEIEQKQVLVVPTRSIVTRSEVTAVYVLSADGGLSFRYIREGRRLDDGNTEVLAGLQSNEQVAVDPVAAGVLLKQQRSSASSD